jgi:hypothetical protein
MKLKDIFEHNSAPHLCIAFDGQIITAINLNTAERIKLPTAKYKPLVLKDISEKTPLPEVSIIVKGGNVLGVSGSQPLNVRVYDYDNCPGEEESDWPTIESETPCKCYGF